MTRYHTKEFRFLLKLAKEVMTAQPNITASQLAFEMHVSDSAAYAWMARVRAGLVVQDPIEVATEFLRANPKATLAEAQAHLGVRRRQASVYLAQARAALKTQQEKAAARSAAAVKAAATRRAGEVPCFMKLKEWP